MTEGNEADLRGERADAALRFKPASVKTLLIAEAPPAAPDRYFYFEHVPRQDSLFQHVALCVLGSKPTRAAKSDALARLRDEGVFLIDLSLDPLTDERRADLAGCLPDVLERSATLRPDRLILIKANVYDLAYRPLRQAGLPIVDVRIPFPGSGQQQRFIEAFGRAYGRPIGSAPNSEHPGAATVMSEEAEPDLPGHSRVQQRAEAILLAALAQQMGVHLAPAKIDLPDGSHVRADGWSPDPPVIVEAWAHQGTVKPAQRNKVLADALKMAHVGAVLDGDWTKILLLADDEASKDFVGRSWYAGALRTLGVQVEVVQIDDALRDEILAAQRRQYR